MIQVNFLTYIILKIPHIKVFYEILPHKLVKLEYTAFLYLLDNALLPFYHFSETCY